MARRLSELLPLVLASLFFVAFAVVTPKLYERQRPQAAPEMEVALPRFVQVLMAAGDRYLAANLAGFRSLVASTERMDADNYRILGIVQTDLAWLNPAHEDNYYIAAAILPWNGEVEAAQEILRRASEARPFDWTPAFYYAFNLMHFGKDPVKGAEWLRVAADQARGEQEKIQLQQLAARWASRGEDKMLAIQMHRALAKETHHKAFARFLERRAVRLENIMLLQSAISSYRKQIGRMPERTEDLVKFGVLASIPSDPFGATYRIEDTGEVVVLQNKSVSNEPRSR